MGCNYFSDYPEILWAPSLKKCTITKKPSKWYQNEPTLPTIFQKACQDETVSKLGAANQIVLLVDDSMLMIQLSYPFKFIKVNSFSFSSAIWSRDASGDVNFGRKMSKFWSKMSTQFRCHTYDLYLMIETSDKFFMLVKSIPFLLIFVVLL